MIVERLGLGTHLVDFGEAWAHQREVHADVVSGRREDTVLLVEQNANQALALADYAYVLENGRIVLEGEGRALLCDGNVKKAYLGAAS